MSKAQSLFSRQDQWRECITARQQSGLSQAAFCQVNQLQYHQFKEKLHDVSGLYLHPPENTVVFCVDEKTLIQLRDRTQPGLPLKKARCGTTTHIEKNGTNA